MTILNEIVNGFMKKPDDFELDRSVSRLEEHLSIPNGTVARRFFSSRIKEDMIAAATSGDRSRVVYAFKSYLQVEKIEMNKRFDTLLSDPVTS